MQESDRRHDSGSEDRWARQWRISNPVPHESLLLKVQDEPAKAELVSGDFIYLFIFMNPY
jgi:hypothetical protein